MKETCLVELLYIVGFLLCCCNQLVTFVDAFTSATDITSPSDEDAANEELRIVGGSTVPQGEGLYRWFAVSTQGSLCGGTLIHDDMILTASHCELAFQDGYNVMIGTTRRNEEDRESDTQYRSVVRSLKHPSYSSFDQVYDFMLVQLNEPVVDFDPIRLNDDINIPADEDWTRVIGFGATSEEGSTTDVLQQVDVQVTPYETCQAQYSAGIDDTSMLCASVNGGGKDSCQGDSGGPLLGFVNGDEYVQIGVVSFGVGCARDSHSGVYARVSVAYSWIQSEICLMSSVQADHCSPTTAPTTDAPRPSPQTVEPVPTIAPTVASSSSATTIAPEPATTPSPTAVTTFPPTTPFPTSSTATIQLRFVFGDSDSIRMWELRDLAKADRPIVARSEAAPKPILGEEVTSVEVPFGTYEISLYDTNLNGSDDDLTIFQLMDNGSEIIISRDDAYFVYQKDLTFVVSREGTPLPPLTLEPSWSPALSPMATTAIPTTTPMDSPTLIGTATRAPSLRPTTAMPTPLDSPTLIGQATRAPTTSPTTIMPTPTTPTTDSPTSMGTASRSPTLRPRTALPTTASPTGSPTEITSTGSKPPVPIPGFRPTERRTLSPNMTPPSSVSSETATSPTISLATLKLVFFFGDSNSERYWELNQIINSRKKRVAQGNEASRPNLSQETTLVEVLYGGSFALSMYDKNSNGSSDTVTVSQVMADGSEIVLAQTQGSFSYQNELTFVVNGQSMLLQTPSSPTTSTPSLSPTYQLPTTPSPVLAPIPGSAALKIVVRYDDSPEGVSWSIEQGWDEVISGGGVSSESSEITPGFVEETWWLAPFGEYRFRMTNVDFEGVSRPDFFTIYQRSSSGNELAIAQSNTTFSGYGYEMSFEVQNL